MRPGKGLHAVFGQWARETCGTAQLPAVPPRSLTVLLSAFEGENPVHVGPGISDNIAGICLAGLDAYIEREKRIVHGAGGAAGTDDGRQDEDGKLPDGSKGDL